MFFFVLAFLGVYLITRLYLTFAFRQTMSMLTMTTVPSAPTTAAVLSSVTPTSSSTSLSELTALLRKACATGNLTVLGAVINLAFNWPFQGNERDDPQMNFELARTLAKWVASGSAPGGVAAYSAEIKRAIQNAMADPQAKAALKAEIAAGTLTTQDTGLDTELASLTS